MSMVNPVDVQYAPETMRRLTLGGCSGGCAAKFLSESEGRRALLGLSWQECSTLVRVVFSACAHVPVFACHTLCWCWHT